MTNHFRNLFLLSFCIIFLSACGGGEKEIIWSPNGEYAAVLGADGLRITDEKGNISPVISKSARLVAWTPDSKECYVCRFESESDWKKVESILSPADLEICRKNAEKVFVHLMQNKDDLDAFGEKVEADKELDHAWAAESILYLKHVHSAEIAEKVPMWKKLKFPEATFKLIEKFDSQDKSLKNPVPIRKTYNDIVSLRVSPNGKALAIVESRKTKNLLVVSPDGKNELLVSSDCNNVPTWNLNGESILYFEAQDKDDSLYRLGYLKSSTVVSKTGSVLPKSKNSKRVLISAFQPEDKIDVLPDDSIVFSGDKLSFPTRTLDFSSKIFLAKPDSEDVVQLVDDTIEDLKRDGFKLSPDGERLLVYGSSGEIYLVNIADKKIELLQSVERSPGEFKFAPSWRNESEICLAVRSTNEVRGENDSMAALMNISDKSVRTISQKWPTSCTEEFLIGKDEGKNRLQEKIDKYTNRR